MCQTHLYSNPLYQKLFPVPVDISGEVEPIMTVSKFIYLWACFQTIVTIYVAFFVSENGVHEIKKDEENEEIDLTFKQTIAIFKDVAMNRNIWTWWLFKMFCNAVGSVGGLGSVYLTNDLGFEKEDFAYVSLITTPIGIVISLAAGYLVSKEPVKTYYYAMFFGIVFNTYYVLYMLRTFPPKD